MRRRRNWLRKRGPAEVPPQGQVAAAFRWMLDGHHWRRHYEPFNKTCRGRDRRNERQMKCRQRDILLLDHDIKQEGHSQ